MKNENQQYERIVSIKGYTIFILRRRIALIILTASGAALLTLYRFLSLLGHNGIAKTVLIKSLCKYFVIGAVLGLLAACAVFFIMYVYGNKLYDEHELSERFGLYNIGVARHAVHKGKIDSALDRWENDGHIPDTEQEYKLIAATVLSLSKDREKSLMITGTAGLSAIEEVVKILDESLGDAQKDFCIVDNPMYDEELLLKVKAYDVILVEAREKSDKRDIEKLVNFLDKSNVEIIGTIVV